MKIRLNNKTFDGKWLWLYELILDVNDFFGCPILFVVQGHNKFQNFHVNLLKWDRKSTKYQFALRMLKISNTPLYLEGELMDDEYKQAYVKANIIEDSIAWGKDIVFINK